MKNLHVTKGLTKPQGDTNICEIPHIQSPQRRLKITGPFQMRPQGGGEDNGVVRKMLAIAAVDAVRAVRFGDTAANSRIYRAATSPKLAG